PAGHRLPHLAHAALDEEVTAALAERVAIAAEVALAGRIDDHVPARADRPGVLRRVVDHLVGPERADPLEVAGAAHRGHVGAAVAGDLHRVDADAPGGAEHQHPLAGPDL